MKLSISQSFYDIVMDFKTNFLILKGGSGSGKSHAITQHIIIHCLSGKHRVLVFRFTGASLEDSVIALFKSVLYDADIPFEYRKAERVMIIGESEVHFKALQDEEKIKSIAGFDMAWVEEANEVYPELWDQLVLRLRTPGAIIQIIASFNPVATSNWTYTYFFDKDSPRYFFRDRNSFKIHESTYKDNPYLPPEYVKNLLAMKSSNPMKYRVYALGFWGVLGKLIFDYGDYEVKHVDIPFNAKYIDGMDLGWVDATALACSAVWREGDIWRIHTYKTWSKSEATADVIAGILKKYCGNRVVYCDNAAAAQIAEIQRNGYYNARPNSKPPGSVIAGIDKLHSMIWTIEPECTDLIADLQIYQWKLDKKTGLYLEEPERGVGDTHQNQCDAVRYSLEALGGTLSNLSTSSMKGL